MKVYNKPILETVQILVDESFASVAAGSGCIETGGCGSYDKKTGKITIYWTGLNGPE